MIPSPEQVHVAVRRYAESDPTGWGTGLSPEGAWLALGAACLEVLQGELDPRALLPPHPTRRRMPPKTLVIWCAANVFTAPLEWVAQFLVLGSRVVLKAPTGAEAPLRALVEAFEGLPVELVEAPHQQAWGLLAQADAVLAFGSDRAMTELAGRIPPTTARSLHGHRASVAVVQGHDAALAEALALDAALHDGAGCMSPAAVFCLGDAGALAENLADAMAHMQRRVPRGAVHPSIGPAWRRRTGLARILGDCLEGDGWAVPLLPDYRAEPATLPRMLPVHPIETLDDLEVLRGWPLSTCATDLDALRSIASLGFCRICAPGTMQRPPLGRPHDGVDVINALCRQISLERS
ncbi:MAG: hypothetical protein H6739_11200 [Alphaproteobacteria bacterium]|nr:hypothetical protein [Alphaproteobacteria bacterium]